MITEKDILRDLDKLCREHIEDYDVLVSRVLRKVDEWRCPSDHIDQSLTDDVWSIIDDIIFDLDKDGDENDAEIYRYFTEDFTLDDLIFFSE